MGGCKCMHPTDSSRDSREDTRGHGWPVKMSRQLIQTLNVPVATAAFDHLSNDPRTSRFQVRDAFKEQTVENTVFHVANEKHF